MPALDLIAAWPVDHAAAGYVAADGRSARAGDPTQRFPLASVTKLLATYAVLIAVEEGSLELDEPVDVPVVRGPVDVVTVRHLLAHTSGLPFEGDEAISAPGRRRIYSNVGIERLADHVAARTGIAFADYLEEAVLVPLGMAGTSLGRRSPAAGGVSHVDDLLRFGAELLAPTLVAADTLRAATTVQFPGLAGVVPGFGRMDPCDWGLGFELKDHKAPHWTGAANAPSTFGHFGGAGTFLWIDPVADLACVALTDRPFDAWAMEVWPALADAVVAEARGGGG